MRKMSISLIISISFTLLHHSVGASELSQILNYCQQNPDLHCASVTQSFKEASPLNQSIETSVFNGKCEFHSLSDHSISKKLVLLLLEKQGVDQHFYSYFGQFPKEMEGGWNPFQYTTIRAMKKASGGFHLEPEQRLFTGSHYSFNELRIAQPNSFQHIYLGQIDQHKLSALGKYGDSYYYCSLTKNIPIPQTDKEKGIPVSFDQHYCKLNYNCNKEAEIILNEYHQLKSSALESIINRPLHGKCFYQPSNPGSESLGQEFYTLFRIEQNLFESKNLRLNQKFIYGSKNNPFLEDSEDELRGILENNSFEAINILRLPTFYFSMSPYLRAWIRVQTDFVYLLGEKNDAPFVCKIPRQ